jgi:hypothetical protein
MFSSESAIYFPADSEDSKLSASPTSKVPEGTDWSIHDFYNTVCLGHESAPNYYLSHNTLSDALYVISQEQQQKYTQSQDDENESVPDLLADNRKSTSDESDIDQHDGAVTPPPILIESLCTTTSQASSFRTIEPKIRSLKKSFMNSFRKQHNHHYLHSNSSSLRFLNFFKRK